MVEIYDVDENAPWRNDPLAKRAVMAAREWNVHRRKGKEALKPQQKAVVDYGMVLLEVRKLHKSNKKYNEEVLARRLDIRPFDDFRQRSAALAIAKAVIPLGDNDREHGFDDCDSGTAKHMEAWAKRTGLIPRKQRNPEATPKAREQIRVAVENGQPVKRDDVSQNTGLSDGAVGRAHAMEQARLEGVIEGEAVALNEQGKFTKAQAKHVEALIKKLSRDLKAQFNDAIEKQVAKLVAARKIALEAAREACLKQRNDAFRDQQHWKQLINGHKPPFSLEEFRAIVMALHPDNSASEETRARAMQSVNDKKLQLTGKP
jgi:hypothetical protein